MPNNKEGYNMKTITSLCIDPEDLTFLDDYGHKKKISRSKLIQEAIKNYIAEKKAEFLTTIEWQDID